MKSSLPLPEIITNDIQGVLNAIGRNVGIHRFLFHGPGRHRKNRVSQQIAAILQRELYVVDFSSVVDSRPRQTAKNIAKLCDEINSFTQPDRVVVLFDEIDALGIGPCRFPTTFGKWAGPHPRCCVNWMICRNKSSYSLQPTYLQIRQSVYPTIRRDDRVRKIHATTLRCGRDHHERLRRAILVHRQKRTFVQKNSEHRGSDCPTPGEMKNLIRSSIAFSKPNDEYDYLRRLYLHGPRWGVGHPEHPHALRTGLYVTARWKSLPACRAVPSLGK